MIKPDPEILQVLGIHLLAVIELSNTLATLTGTDAKELLMTALAGAKDQLEACSPEALEDLCYGVITAATTPPPFDPVVLFDPIDGPITDSQLRKICEDA